VLSAVYIKGFKTFARPVRMPLEAGVTAIVGPNGSGKSNITDAVLFALGEQSAGVLRAGTMGDLIFSGSETLPASAAAEVTLVLNNESGSISLPYQEVSISRRISRGGDTEYRVNGSRARLADVHAVAGEAGLGRHSILRQGAVDAIVAGGAAACRQALEEAAGLGFYRRRRISASRRLERASVQLEQSRELEAELAGQLRRIEREAVAAREYREIESRYRKLSLAHLYGLASQGLEERRDKLSESERLVKDFSLREAALKEEESRLMPELRAIERTMRELESRTERLDDEAENLRTESLSADRILLRVEAKTGGNDDGRRLASRLQAELERVSRALVAMEKEMDQVEDLYTAKRNERDQLRQAVAKVRDRIAAAEKARSRLAGEVESLRGRLERGALRETNLSTLPDNYLDEMAGLAAELEGCSVSGLESAGSGLRSLLEKHRSKLEEKTMQASRRQGAMQAALGRAESSIRALADLESRDGMGTRLHEVIRPRPGFEGAMEAALGDYAGGLMAENITEGLKLLSYSERVALRLDASPMEEKENPPGPPLLDCVEILDERYAPAVERILDGIYVVDEPEKDHLENGHVIVTRGGLRLTRTSVSLGAEGGRFSRGALLASERQRLESLKTGPSQILYDCQEELSNASARLEPLSRKSGTALTLASRVNRALNTLARETKLRQMRAEHARDAALSAEREANRLNVELDRIERDLLLANETAERIRTELSEATSAFENAEFSYEETARRRSRLLSAISEGRKRHEGMSIQLRRLGVNTRHDEAGAARVAARAAKISRKLAVAAREHRNRLRSLRTEAAERHRNESEKRATISRRAVELAGQLATARAEAEHARMDLRTAETSASEALEEIQTEWGATLDEARRESEESLGGDETERHRLARKLKRFGDVNLLALSQQEQLRERYQLISEQRSDAEAATNELNRIILEVDREIETRFSETFSGVRSAFAEIVPRMIAGAAGVLDLSEEGVEVGLRLGRKGWRPLHVLSGGERALLALSFLFSIFLSRPGRTSGAFCILDEAEAALDDINLARFIAVVDSYRSNGQFLLVTHQKRTMAAADVLYGVVQDAAGATTVVSKRMQGD